MPAEEAADVTAEWLAQAEQMRQVAEALLAAEVGPITTVSHQDDRPWR